MTDQTRPMDAERIAKIRQRAEAATPFMDDEWKALFLPSLSYHETELTLTIDDVEGPFATFLATLGDDIPDLLAEVARLGADRDAALLDVARMRDTQKDMGSLDDAVAAIHRRYPDDPYAEYLTSRLEDAVQPRKAELAALRAVVEEARDYLNRASLSATYKEFNDAVLVAQDALDRGLKGAGE